MQSHCSASAAFAPGKHYLIDFHEASNLSDVENISDVLKQAATACGATILDIKLHSFGANAGVTGVALLAESHISIHTWPERAYAAIDIFMCGNCDPELAIAPLTSYFIPGEIKVIRHQRGEADNSIAANSQKTITQDNSCVNDPTNKIA
jgi:S-adenosylmethionine decarboxylase